MKEKDNKKLDTGDKIFVTVLVIVVCSAIGFLLFMLGCLLWYDCGLEEDFNDISKVINFKSIPDYDVSLWKNKEIDDKEFERRIRKVLYIPNMFYFDGHRLTYPKNSKHPKNMEVELNWSLQKLVIFLPSENKNIMPALTNYFGK